MLKKKRKSDVEICLGIPIVQIIPIKCIKTCQYLPIAEFAHHLLQWPTQGHVISLLLTSTHYFPQLSPHWLPATLKHTRITTNLGLLFVSSP